jgi:hypothetical protein
MSTIPENLPPPEGFEIYGYGPVPEPVRKLTNESEDLWGFPFTWIGSSRPWVVGRVGLYDTWVYAARIGSPTHAMLFADKGALPPTSHEF